MRLRGRWAFRTSGRQGAAPTPRRGYPAHVKKPQTFRFLALGDSYTIGEGVAETERWPAQLTTMLRTRGVEVAEPEIIATTGWTTDELAAGIAAANPRGPYGLVSLLIGVNNQYRGQTLEEYARDFALLVETAVALAGGDPFRVLVLSIPDWSVTPFAEGRDRTQIAAEIDRFNAVNFAITVQAGPHYVDVTEATRRAPAAVAADGLHPSGAMYGSWATLCLRPALAALGVPG